MLIDLGIVLALVLMNGLFAMSEIAMVSAKKAPLTQLAESGAVGAKQALALAAEPTRFLSSIQVSPASAS
jgi:putative hemolysin